MDDRLNFLIVDGHSLIFGWEELRKLHERRQSLARDELIRILTRHQDVTDYRVVLVFDGQGTKITSTANDSPIQVIYSKSGQTADSVIERLAARYSKVHRLIVCSNDRMIHQTVTSFGAETLSADQFALELKLSENVLQSLIRKHSNG